MYYLTKNIKKLGINDPKTVTKNKRYDSQEIRLHGLIQTEPQTNPPNRTVFFVWMSERVNRKKQRIHRFSFM